MHSLASITKIKEQKALLNSETVVTIGNFDGCHLGHQSLLKRTVQIAKQEGLSSVVVCFNPRPKVFFTNVSLDDEIFTFDQKSRSFEELGLDYFLNQKFDLNFSQLSCEDFYSLLLRKILRCKKIIVGEDFCFGHKRSGNSAWLSKRAKEDSVSVEILSPLFHNKNEIGSSLIRSQLKDRLSFKNALNMLGRPYLLEGKIVSNKKMGRKIGFPTANIEMDHQLIPALGVYAGYTLTSDQNQNMPILTLPSRAKKSVFNIGYAPSIKNSSGTIVSIESHILDQDLSLDSLLWA